MIQLHSQLNAGNLVLSAGWVEYNGTSPIGSLSGVSTIDELEEIELLSAPEARISEPARSALLLLLGATLPASHHFSRRAWADALI